VRIRNARQKQNEMTTQLTPLTKELIFSLITDIEKQIQLKSNVIFEASKDENNDTFRFTEIWKIERELLEIQLDHLKQLLFN